MKIEKSNIKKFITFFSVALIISLSIPHVLLWNFGIGIGKALEDYEICDFSHNTKNEDITFAGSEAITGMITGDGQETESSTCSQGGSYTFRQFKKNDMVKANVNLNVREGQGTDKKIIATVSIDSIGRVLDGPQTVGDFDWYHIEWVSGEFFDSQGNKKIIGDNTKVKGWSAQGCKSNGKAYLIYAGETIEAGETKYSDIKTCEECIKDPTKFIWCSVSKTDIKNGKCIERSTGGCPDNYPNLFDEFCYNIFLCYYNKEGYDFICTENCKEENYYGGYTSIDQCKKDCMEYSLKCKDVEATPSSEYKPRETKVSKCEECHSKGLYYCAPDPLSGLSTLYQRGQCGTESDCPNPFHIAYGSDEQCPPIPSCEELCTAYYYGNVWSGRTYQTTQLSIPTGKCSKENPMFIYGGIYTRQSTQEYIETPQPIGVYPDVDCEPGERCWCTRINIASFQQTKTNTANLNYQSATIPGTTFTVHWKPPNELKNPPKGKPNDYTGKPSNGTINARISQNLVMAGNSITITGSVTKLCNECNGYQYKCLKFQELTCDIKDSRYKIKWSYKQCPADLPERVAAEGEGTAIKWSNIIGDLGLAVSVLLPIFGPSLGIGIETVKEALQWSQYIFITSETAREILASTGHVVASGWPVTDYAENKEQQNKQNSDNIQDKKLSTLEYERLLYMIRSAAASYQTGSPYQRTCYSVCGKYYDSEKGYAPLCHEGGVPIESHNITYECSQGSCGPWKNKKVKIEIRASNGNVIKEDYTTTDSKGQFSYSFAAPQMDGELTAIVTVPKDW
ncbi:MAG: hypothetical protein QXD48_00985 [Candidatus Aenigmatarchaeota archaeon]